MAVGLLLAAAVAVFSYLHLRCAPGTFNSGDQCVPCGRGFTSSGFLRRVCEECPANHYCPDPATSWPSPCPPGSAAAPGSSRCTPCPLGSVVSKDGHCEACPLGSRNNHPSEPCECMEGYQPGPMFSAMKVVCTPCPVGRWDLTGSKGASYESSSPTLVQSPHKVAATACDCQVQGVCFKLSL
jgi:hypothetical protein